MKNTHTGRLVAYLDSSPGGIRLAGLAVAVARMLHAELTVVWGLRRPHLSAPETFARGGAIGEVLHHHAGIEAAAVSRARRAFQAMVGGQNVRADFRPVWSDVLSEEALPHVGDVVVFGNPAPIDLPQGLSAESLLLAGHNPILLIPDDWRKDTLAPVLIAWNGAEAARRAVHDALSLLVAAERAVVLVVDGAASPASTAALIAEIGVEGVETTLMEVNSGPATTAEAIANVALDVGAGLIVMGGYSRSPTLERMFGGVTRAFLKKTPRPLLLSHPSRVARA